MEQAIDMKQVLKSAALEALREFRKEEQDKIRRGRLRNTRLLMENYLEFIEHFENIKSAVAEAFDEDEEINFDEIEMDDIIIQSIMRTKVRTKVMVRQIETVVGMLKMDQMAKGETEKYEVVELLYLDKEKKDLKFNARVEIVAQQLNCHEGTVRRWNNEMIDKIAIKLFGVDGLKFDI